MYITTIEENEITNVKDFTTNDKWITYPGNKDNRYRGISGKPDKFKGDIALVRRYS